MSRKPTLLAFAAAALLAGCASDDDRTPRSQQLWTPQGEPVSCINRSQIRSTHVIDDRTINFVINNRRMFRNELRNSCPGLGFSRAFKINARTPQVCSVDTITVIQGGRRGATCGLGRFQPMVPVESATPAAAAPAPPR